MLDNQYWNIIKNNALTQKAHHIKIRILFAKKGLFKNQSTAKKKKWTGKNTLKIYSMSIAKTNALLPIVENHKKRKKTMLLHSYKKKQVK